MPPVVGTSADVIATRNVPPAIAAEENVVAISAAETAAIKLRIVCIPVDPARAGVPDIRLKQCRERANGYKMGSRRFCLRFLQSFEVCHTVYGYIMAFCLLSVFRRNVAPTLATQGASAH